MYMTAEEHRRAAWLRGDAHTVTALDQAEAEHADALQEERRELEALIEAAKASADELAEQLRAIRAAGPAVEARQQAEVAAAKREDALALLYGRALKAAADAMLSPAAKTAGGRRELSLALQGLSRARGDELLTYQTTRLAQLSQVAALPPLRAA